MNTEANVRSLMSVEKINKVVARFEQIVSVLSHSSSLALHRNVDLSFYQQKIAEFTLLKEQMLAALHALEDIQIRACLHYSYTFPVLIRDLRTIQQIQSALPE